MTRRTVRVHRKDSAFVCAILDSLEGMASFSTLPDALGQDFREILISIPEGFELEIDTVLNGLRKRFPVIEKDQN